ncbi:EAL domain-containing protein [Geodermatophilus sp. SYSU D00691]
MTWLLDTARERVGTDVAYLADFTDREQRVRLVAGHLDTVDIAAGLSAPIEGTFCVRVLSGLVPPVVNAAGRDSRTRDLAEPVGIGAYVGAPIRAADGRAVGMLCCLSQSERAQLDADSARFVEFLAELVSQRIGVLDDEERARDRFVEELPGRGMRTVFQPIVEIGSGRTVAYEALTRFDGADTATVFAQAALSGRGTIIERVALAAVLDVLDARPLDVPVSVNLSPDALVDADVLDLLLTDRPQVVGVEITEHRPIRDYTAVLRVRERLRRAGLPVSVDDAGAGYASLRHVLRLEPDTIKLDAGIVSGVHADPARQALVTAMVGFAEGIGASVVAEGVEVPAERDLLAARGIQLGQGWLWGRPGPLPAEDALPEAG